MFLPQKEDFVPRKKVAKKDALNKANLTLQLGLSSFEKEILLKACKNYRARIPSYLLSKQSELKAIDRIIKKLI